jgi:hypothetical protein
LRFLFIGLGSSAHPALLSFRPCGPERL